MICATSCISVGDRVRIHAPTLKPCSRTFRTIKSMHSIFNTLLSKMPKSRTSPEVLTEDATSCDHYIQQIGPLLSTQFWQTLSLCCTVNWFSELVYIPENLTADEVGGWGDQSSFQHTIVTNCLSLCCTMNWFSKLGYISENLTADEVGGWAGKQRTSRNLGHITTHTIYASISQFASRQLLHTVHHILLDVIDHFVCSNGFQFFNLWIPSHQVDCLRLLITPTFLVSVYILQNTLGNLITRWIEEIKGCESHGGWKPSSK